MRYLFEGALNSNLHAISDVTGHLIDTLERFLEDESTLFDVRLVLSELLINGYEHGNRSNRNKRIYVTLNLADNDITLSVRDEGQGFVFDCTDPLDPSCCSGRGLMLVQKLADSVEIDNNCITAVLSRPRA
ncbi:MAG: ATP-binding protein [Tissierellia bacterium]|jgi:serine/threonine-protein kinase RsbW|nr:ATP-binding protein [Bacillota bacterium]NLK58546.1 ATP-binding protein [Tissierellia bacterium]